MQIVSTRSLPLAGVHLLRYRRFSDARGYFTETFRRSDFDGVEFLAGIEFVQSNESYSRAGVVRGLHLQWNPHMGKLVRTVQGRMIDLVLDVRRGSPTYGKAVAVDLPAHPDDAESEWIWVPPGFAHGNAFTEPTTIEYLCSGEYSPGCEAGISPLAADVDWSLCEPDLRSVVTELLSEPALMSDRDRDGLTLAAWGESEGAGHFVFGEC